MVKDRDSKRRYERWCTEHAVKKKIKRDRERFRRGKISLFKGADKLYRDGCDTGRQRYLYVCILEKKSDDDPGKFSEYVSHREDTWPPKKTEVDEHFPLTERWLSEDFDPEAKKAVERKIKSNRSSFAISTPPQLKIRPTDEQELHEKSASEISSRDETLAC
ncbi:hypothetical protein EMCG_04996 [[Emmonsia] crescens]|uniref:Uncharacterized protein n=1 Tax=[Emmonsia] crescens TaxID=73230 RepID=A0A0G2IY50_9EURO|nr:hypothetical protein EMCG_04996 [Emmonsia crescens UAMH 3008]